jgi:hypothetical protein
MAKINLRTIQNYPQQYIKPYYKGGYLIGFQLRQFGQQLMVLRYFTEDALAYLLQTYPKEIHADGVK